MFDKNNKENIPEFNYVKRISINNIREPEWIIPIIIEEDSSVVLDKIKSTSIILEEEGSWYDGMKIVGKAKEFAFQKTKPDNSFYPMHLGADIESFKLSWSGMYCCRDKEAIEKLGATDIRLRSEKAFKGEKIIVRKTGNKIIAAIDADNYYFEQSLFGFVPEKSSYHIKVLTAILNSRISLYLLRLNSFSKKETFPQIRLHWLKQFPIPKIDFTNKDQKEKHDNIVSLVTQLMQAKKKLSEAKTEREKNLLKHQCESCETGIDNLVYELYGLTDEERDIVERV